MHECGSVRRMNTKTNGFLAETFRQLELRPVGSVERLALEFLTSSCVGREQAATGERIEEEMAKHGLKMNKYAFQKALVAPSRKKDSGWFIGSSRRGFFIIQDAEDLAEASSYCMSRIAAQMTNFGNLHDQADGYGLSRFMEAE